jgi:CubicO group peptidase (beta-lactamase class C family)
MPAGGLFSTATDCARFMQMVLNNGTFEGKRHMSPEAVKLMTGKQTPPALSDPYGFGWSAGEVFGHGGACATNMEADTKLGMVTVYMIQHTNGFPGEGGMARETFVKAAREQFPKA